MDRVIYQLTTEDIQTVAGQELGRSLSVHEIAMLKDTIASKISWYEIIADSINEVIVDSENKS